MAISIDPICKMKVEETNCKITSEHNGKKYYFCAPGCKKAFDKTRKNMWKKKHRGAEAGKPFKF